MPFGLLMPVSTTFTSPVFGSIRVTCFAAVSVIRMKPSFVTARSFGLTPSATTFTSPLPGLIAMTRLFAPWQPYSTDSSGLNFRPLTDSLQISLRVPSVPMRTTDGAFMSQK